MKLCLVGGFLGGGKTTAITAACKMLLQEGRPVAVITNDQGSRLVDTAFAKSLSIPGNEVKNGCFCCNYEQLDAAVRDLQSSKHPDIIFAEAVGSCADLVATIVRPLIRYHPGMEINLSVFADGPLLLSSLEGRSSFINENIQYIYKKQLEEAGILIVNKMDLLTDSEVAGIGSILGKEYPSKKILFQDSRDEDSIRKWLAEIDENDANEVQASLEIGYDQYAAGEAALAWLDAYVIVHSKGRAIDKCAQLMDDMFGAIRYRRLPIGHLKFFLEANGWQQKISYSPGAPPAEYRSVNSTSADRATLLVNARIETHPDQLKQVFFQAIKRSEHPNCHIEVREFSSFQPGYPRPRHRFQ